MSVAKPAVPQIVNDDPDVRVSNEAIICIESDGNYVCRFDAGAAAIFRTTFAYLHEGKNFLTAYEKGKGKYYLYNLMGLDKSVQSPDETCPPVRLEMAQRGNDIGNPPPRG